jgi:iron complex outermembrane receptor protein
LLPFCPILKFAEMTYSFFTQSMKRLALVILQFFLFTTGFSQSIHGKVSNTRNEPLSGVTVHLLNTNLGTMTDNEGSYQLHDLKPGTYRVQVSAIGFATIEQIVSITDDENLTDFQLTEAATQLDDVIVTAQKTEEEIQKVPLSVSAISSVKVQQYRMWSSKDITAVVPNLFSSNPGDNRNVTSIRGITSTSYDPSVTTYVDGVNQFSLDTYIAPLVDVERIEVLRGPQGTLYGRNAMGGVINIITKQPDSRTSGFSEINLGTYGQQRYTAGVRMPLVKDKLFLSVSGLYEQSNGFYTNEYDNSHFDKKHSLVGNYYLRYIVSPSWVFTLNLKHNENRNGGTFPLSYDAISNPFKVNQNSVTTMVDNVFNGSFSASYAGRVFNFSSQTTYQSNWRYYKQPIDGDFSPIDGVTIINNYGKAWNKVKAWTQEFKFTSPALESKVKWTGGIYLFHQDNPSKQATHFGNDAAFIDPNAIPNSSLINTSTGRSTGFAFFGQTTYSLSKKLDLISGLRYDFERKKLSVKGEYEASNALFTTRPDTAASADFAAISPKVGLSFRASGQSHLYFNYSRGFRTGGLTPLSSDPSQPPLFAYQPEYSNNLELGIKENLFEHKLRLSTTLFYIRATDVQVPTLVLPQAVTITRNAGELESKGVEAEVSATPLPHLQLDYNFGYTDARYTSLTLSKNGAEANLKGNHQLFTPNNTSMLAIQYDLNLNASHTVKLIGRFEWMHLGDLYFDLANTIRQSGYNLLNARVGVTVKDWELFLWGRNLSDTRYISYAYDFGAAHLGDPQNIGISLRKNF